MMLPFSPNYKRRIDTFEQLMEYESQSGEKRLWGGEKAFLIWARSEGHQHLGSSVGADHLKNALELPIVAQYVSESEKSDYLKNGRHIVESLITHKMATLDKYIGDKNPRVKVSDLGILAGQILIETNNLRNTSRYKWEAWFSKLKLELLVSAVALIISIVSLSQGKSALQIANQANDLVAEGNKIQSDGLTFSKEERSQKYVESVFNELYQNKDNLETITQIRSNQIVKDKNRILNVVDTLESTGSSFCQGTVWKLHLNISLKNTLQGVCDNQQIVNEFGGRKNGLAMLCREFFADSQFAKTLQTYNLMTCMFHDSSELKSLMENQ